MSHPVDSLPGDVLVELLTGGDAVRFQEMRQHGGGGVGVGQRIVRSDEGDPVSLAQRAQPMWHRSAGIEAARQPERAQRATHGERRADLVGSLAQEGEIEVGVVGDEHCVINRRGQPLHDLGQRWGVSDVAATDAVELGRTDPIEEPPAWSSQACPSIDHRAAAIDDDDADLQHPITPDRQTRRLDIDHREPHGGAVEGVHVATLFRRCDDSHGDVGGGVSGGAGGQSGDGCDVDQFACARARTPMGAATVKPAR